MLAYDFPVLIHMVQNLAAVSGDDDQILHADAEFAGQIDAGLYGEDHAFSGHVLAGRAYIAGIVVLQADHMAKAVGKEGTVPSGGDMFSGNPVDLAQGNAGTDDGLRFFIGLPDQIVNGGVGFIRFFAEEGAGHVGAVAVLNTAHVDYDAVSLF